MKSFLLMSCLLASMPGLCFAQDTAYKALRAVGTSKGEKALNQIVEIKGDAGHSEPSSWKVTLSDPGARGGYREYGIVSNQISSERAPLKSDLAGSRPIDLSNLNLDSDGAFRVAEREAQRNHIGFDSVNYRLASGSNGKPIWRLTLLDTNANHVGTVRVAADTGNLLGTGDWVQGSSGTSRAAADTASAPPPPPPTTASGARSGHGSRSSQAPLDYRQMPDYQQEPQAPPPPSADDSSGYSSSRNYDNSARRGPVHQEVHDIKEQLTDVHRNWTHQTKNFFRNFGDWFHDKVHGGGGGSSNYSGGERQTDDREYQQAAPQQAAPQRADQYNTPVQPVPQQ